jgi:MFS family permease
MLTARQLKIGYFILEGLNSFATVFYFYYLYFFLERAFGFDNKANLLVAALNGMVCALSSWQGGRFAQRIGYLTALKIGFSIMIAGLSAGLVVHSATAQIIVSVIVTAGMCLTWPTLEALVSQGESAANLPGMIGLYNVIWAATGALAYFTGGAMLDTLGLSSMFYVPAVLILAQLGLTFWLHRQARAVADQPSRNQLVPAAANARSLARAKVFVRMAWLANPFAYIAIQTLVAVMPGIANKLELSAMLAGFWGSVWCFARLGAFLLFWHWEGWHYRFRWLISAYLSDPHRAEPRRAGGSANFSRTRARPDLLLVALLFDGRGRSRQ